jgi:hypothetical protein
MTALRHRENDLIRGIRLVSNGEGQELTNEDNDSLLVLKQATKGDGFTLLVPDRNSCGCLQRLRVNCLGWRGHDEWAQDA